MNLIAHLAADAASFSFHPADGSGASSFETPWHRAVLRFEDEAGNVLKSVEAFAHGKVDVRGEADTPHEVGAKPETATDAEPEHRTVDEVHEDDVHPDDMAAINAMQPVDAQPDAEPLTPSETDAPLSEQNRNEARVEAPDAALAEGVKVATGEEAEGAPVNGEASPGFAAFSHHVDEAT